ncbi:hypothetical protein OG689_02445 [Kitasatospora sp. NBC_00240]|uniref:FAD-dependent monooxygenase n=1 Tax=Kitasatospora sp. NBC_00240 TaxID=2903567 RepID=UPI0022529B58|nr:FAD-dependent monooxygenase [Kitasatospora sp. NBC_00240]MCX5208177.1 hypothetical protein [Kitasatospora sp. NBC_00240]
MSEARRTQVLVAGSGQAGRAVGHHLRRAGLDFTILDAATERSRPRPTRRARYRHDGGSGSSDSDS